jgi:hypothetical protein
MAAGEVERQESYSGRFPDLPSRVWLLWSMIRLATGTASKYMRSLEEGLFRDIRPRVSECMLW